VTARAGDIRLAAWSKLMGAHARLVQRVGRGLAAVTTLPLGSYNVLRLLQEAPGCRLRLGELAGAVHLTRSGVTRLAKRLERRGCCAGRGTRGTGEGRARS
jgi:DNA-binding MarR family transcriptional regulator